MIVQQWDDNDIQVYCRQAVDYAGRYIYAFDQNNNPVYLGQVSS